MLERLYYWVSCYVLFLCIAGPLSLGFYFAFLSEPCLVDWLRKRLLDMVSKNPKPKTNNESEDHENE